MTPNRLASALRARAQGLHCPQAAAELLIAQTWFHRADFRNNFINITPHLVDGQAMANVDWAAAINALDAGGLPCSAGEQRMLRITASIGDGIPVNLQDSLTGLDERNIQLLIRALLHTSGRHPRPVT
jgi:hypothetical protein